MLKQHECSTPACFMSLLWSLSHVELFFLRSCADKRRSVICRWQDCLSLAL